MPPMRGMTVTARPSKRTDSSVRVSRTGVNGSLGRVMNAKMKAAENMASQRLHLDKINRAASAAMNPNQITTSMQPQKW